MPSTEATAISQTSRELIGIAAHAIRGMVEERRAAIDSGAVAAGNQFLAGMYAAFSLVEDDLKLLEDKAS